MLVLSSETASILIRTTCSRCSSSNILSSTPALAQRRMRVYPSTVAFWGLGQKSG